MKKKIREITELSMAIFVGFITIMVIVFIFFYIRVSYFPLESLNPDLSIEEQIRKEQMLFYKRGECV